MIAEAAYRFRWARFHIGELITGLVEWSSHLSFGVIIISAIVFGWLVAAGWGAHLSTVLLFMGAMLSAMGVPLAPHIWLKAAASLVALAWIIAGLAAGLAVGQVTLGYFDLPFLAVAASAILSTLMSDAPQVSLGPSETYGDGLLTVLSYVATGLAVLHLPGPLRGFLLEGILAAGAVVGLVAILHAQQVPWARRIGTQFGWRQDDRPPGTMCNPMHLGGYGILLLPVAILAGFQAWPWMVAVLLIGAAIVLAASRTAWAALVPMAVLWGIHRPPTPEQAVLLAGIGMAALGLLMTWAWAARRMPPDPPKVGVPVDLTPWVWVLRRLTSFDGLGSRWRIWRDVVILWTWRPVAGWGFNALVILRDRRFLRLPMQDTLGNFGPGELWVDQAHNEILSWAFSTGILGLAAYAWLWVMAFTHATNIAVLCGLFGYAIWLLTGWTHLGPANVLYAFFGLALAGTR